MVKHLNFQNPYVVCTHLFIFHLSSSHILYFLFYVRIVGAGDIKLLCGIGSFVHLGIVKIVILSFILTACMGVLIVTVNIVSAYYTRTKQLTRIHLSIPIALATAIYLCVG